jgi:hypothetical protein
VNIDQFVAAREKFEGHKVFLKDIDKDSLPLPKTRLKNCKEYHHVTCG